MASSTSATASLAPWPIRCSLGRLGIKPGDRIKLGSIEIAIRGLIATEPDRISDGIVLGPRLLLSEEALRATGIVQPGSLDHLALPREAGRSQSRGRQRGDRRRPKETFPDAGWRVRNRNNAASGADGFIERLGYFMTLVGLASLIVGGAGIANAVPPSSTPQAIPSPR